MPTRLNLDRATLAAHALPGVIAASRPDTSMDQVVLAALSYADLLILHCTEEAPGVGHSVTHEFWTHPPERFPDNTSRGPDTFAMPAGIALNHPGDERVPEVAQTYNPDTDR